MKITDRVLLGVACGLLANLPKVAILHVGRNRGMTDIPWYEKSAGMFIDPKEIHTKTGIAVGALADSVIAGMLGVVNVYLLSIWGPRYAPLKGAIAGQGMWQGLYGVLSSMGATKIRSVTPRTALAEFLAHTAYGASTAVLAVSLGDSSLFASEPLINVPWAQQGKEDGQEQQPHLSLTQWRHQTTSYPDFA